jgi:hypothetical protein
MAAKCKTGAREECPWNLRLVISIIGLILGAIITLISYLSAIKTDLTETTTNQTNSNQHYVEDKQFILQRLDTIQKTQIKILEAVARLEASIRRSSGSLDNRYHVAIAAKD